MRGTTRFYGSRVSVSTRTSKAKDCAIVRPIRLPVHNGTLSLAIMAVFTAIFRLMLPFHSVFLG